MIKVILIIPPYSVIIDRFGLPDPFNICYLGTVLKKNGHDVKILDCDAMGINIYKLAGILLREKPQVVGVTATTHTRFSAIKCVEIARRSLPKAHIVVGGPHFTATSDDALRAVPDIDSVVRGEGENTIVELVNTIENKGDFRKINGLSFREGEDIIHTQERQVTMDLDSLPFPDRNLLKNGSYFEKLPYSDMPCKSILSSRGCPFNCTFCFPHNRAYRRRSTGNILDEVEYLMNAFNVQAIRFFDLTFTVGDGNVKEFCEEILKRNLKFSWYCESRVDIDLGLLGIMKRAGLYSLDFGMESASKKVLKSINKKIDPQQALDFAMKCNELGIITKAFLMISLPDEDIEDAEETFRFAKKLSKYVPNIGISMTQIIPGTDLEKKAKELNILPQNFSWNSKYRSKISKIFTGNKSLPVYIEKLPLDYLTGLYQRYSIMEVYNKGRGGKLFLKKLMKATTNWDKGLIFKLKWLISYLKYRNH